MKSCLAAAAAIAAACAACPASAQSSVMLFGVVDAALGSFESRSGPAPQQSLLLDPLAAARGSVNVRRRALVNSGHNSSRLGFRGVEDLGGGLAASFWLEAPISNDDGQTGIAAFSRRSTVSMSGGFGELRLGRDYTPTFWNDSVMDPFGQVGPGTNLMLAASTSGAFAANTSYARVSNSIGYFLPKNLRGFYGQLMYGFHENSKYSPANATPPGVAVNGRVAPGAVQAVRAGRYAGGRFGYAEGPLDLAVAYSSNTVADSFYAGTTDVVRTANLGVSYDFDVAKLTAEASRVKRVRQYSLSPLAGATPDTGFTGFLVGLQVPVGPGLVRASYARVRYDRNALLPGTALDPVASKIALGYVHNLSKRTALYATVARVRNRHGASLTVGGAPAFVSGPSLVPAGSTGYVLGIRHAF